MIKAVFFDFDGVLFDSETWITEIEKRFFIDSGALNFDDNDLYESVGGNKNMKLWHNIFVKNKQLFNNDYEFMIQKMKEYKSDYMNQDFNELLFPGVRSILDYLSNKNYYLAVASSSNKEYLIKHLEECNLLRYFSFVLSGYDFKRSKPYPDIYLKCLEKLNLSHTEAVVVEDSFYGISSAKNARIFTYAIKDTKFGIDQSNADVIIDDISKLKLYL